MIRLLLAAILFVSTVASGAPLAVKGRTGISEFYLLYTLRHYLPLVTLCFDLPACSDRIRDSLAQLEDSHLIDSSSVQFQLTKDMGNVLYRISGDDVITINKDLLFIVRNGRVEPFVYPDAIDFFARVWGARLKWSANQISLVASRLSALGTAYGEETLVLEAGFRQFGLARFERPISSLVMEDYGTGEQSVTFEVPFATSLSCGPSTGIESPLLEVRVLEARWSPVGHLASNRALLTVSGLLQYRCEDGAGRRQTYQSNYRVQIDAAGKSGAWWMDPSTLRIQQNGIHALSAEHD